VGDSIPSLDPRWLEELGDDRPPPEDAEARAWARLAAALPLSEAAGTTRARSPEASGPRIVSAPRVAARGPFRGWASHLLTFAGGSVLGVAVAGSLLRAPARIVYVDRPLPPPIVETPIDANPVVSEAVPPPVEWPVTHSPAPGSVSSASQFAAERRLLDAARASLGEGEPEKALAKLEQHRAHFPHGMLSEERDAMFVLALVKAGREEEARARASSFLQRGADSLFRSAVRAAIQSISVTKNPSDAKP
jgi:hypothetical protein